MRDRRENWPGLRHVRGCGCPGCRNEGGSVEALAQESLSVALRHAQDSVEAGSGFEAATPGGAVALPGVFSGWAGAIPLTTVLHGSAPDLFVRPRKRQLYRIYEELERTPLYIGMAYAASIRDRVTSHLGKVLTPSGGPTALAQTLAKQSPDGLGSEVKKLQILVARNLLSPARKAIKVQRGSVTAKSGFTLDPKLLHAFEATLQVLEQPRSYVSWSRAFEEDLMAGLSAEWG